MKQIGQILVEQGWVDPAALARALADQPHTGRRLCSLLILRGALDPDHAARALSEQHGVPGVLQKHLEHRDLTLPALLPAALARSHVALPIGRTSSGALIVCVRDPLPDVLAAITEAVSGPVVIAVAPAYQLEHLVAETYSGETGAGDELVLELEFPARSAEFLHDTAPPAATPATPATPAAPAAPSSGDDDEVEVDLSTRRIPVIGNPLDHLGSMTLVGLDDARVAKDPSQSGQHEAILPRAITGGYPPPRATTGGYPPPRTTTGGYPPPRTTTGGYPPPRTTTGGYPPPRTTTGGYPPPRTTTGGYPPPRTTTGGYPPPRTTTGGYPPPRTVTSSYPPRTAAHPGPPRGAGSPASPGPALDASIAAIDGAASVDDATDAAMYYLAGRFHRAVWFTVHQGAALGERGHGDQLTADVIQAIAIPLGAPSILQVAHDSRRLATAAPPDAGAIQDRLWRALGGPESLAAVPIELGAQIVAVIAVGDPLGDPANAGADLERLGRALGAAFLRITGA